MNKAFRKQLWLSCGLVLVCSVMNTVFRHWIFSSIGFCLCGLLWVAHPIRNNDIQSEKKQFAECRIAGIVLILMGFMLRARLY